MTLEELRNAVCRHIDENRDAYNETGDECYRAVKEELLHILGLIDTVDHEPVGKDKLTLKELARELRKVLKFRYLTAERPIHNLYFALWNQKTVWNGESWRPADNSDRHIVTDFLEFEVVGKVDISEYADENGNIDYSKCIVEVEG